MTDEQIDSIYEAELGCWEARNKCAPTLWHAFAHALLSASKPAAPEGWKLVPVEPTDEMTKTGTQYAECAIPANAVFAYRAMLAASPAVQAQSGEPVAWKFRKSGWVNWFYVEWASDSFGDDAKEYERIPLYAAPPAQTVQSEAIDYVNSEWAKYRRGTTTLYPESHPRIATAPVYAAPQPAQTEPVTYPPKK